MHRLLPRLGRLYVVMVFAFIFLPLLLVLLISFSTDNYLNFPPHGWGFRYYYEVLGNADFMNGMRTSAIVATVVMMLSLVFGLPAAWALTRLEFRGREFLRSFVLVPLVLPTIVLGLGILMVFTRLGLTATYPGLVLAHLVMTLPFAVRILQTTLGNLGVEVEHAAMTLGARPLQAFRYITLPRLLPGLIAAGAISAILSFDEIVVSLFIVGPRLSTLPVAIYRYVNERTDPMVAVLAVLLIAISLGIVLIVERSVGFARAFGR